MFARTKKVLSAAVAVLALTLVAGNAEGQVASAEAEAFIGDWNVEVGGELAASFRINITDSDGTVAVAITGSEGGNFTGENIRKTGERLVFNYTSSIQGQAVPIEVSLTPGADGLTGSLDLAGGMAQAPLTATRRDS